jgi:hypothetical protein
MKHYPRYFSLYVFLILFSMGMKGQTNSALHNSTISTSGSTVTLSNNFVVQQSIGQQGPIGLVSTSDIQVRQGFIQPSVLKAMLYESDNTELQATIFPNPTSDHLTISFDEIVDSDINIYLYDVNGRLVLNKEVYGLFDIQFSVLHLQTGNYFLIATSDSKQFVTQVSILH